MYARDAFLRSQLFRVCSVAAIALVAKRLNETVEERVIVLEHLGIQLERRSPFRRSVGRFIATADIQSIVIHEGFER